MYPFDGRRRDGMSGISCCGLLIQIGTNSPWHRLICAAPGFEPQMGNYWSRRRNFEADLISRPGSAGLLGGKRVRKRNLFVASPGFDCTTNILGGIDVVLHAGRENCV